MQRLGKVATSWDKDGKSIGSCGMTAERAFQQGQYLIENAFHMLSVRQELRRMQDARELADRVSVLLTASQKAAKQ